MPIKPPTHIIALLSFTSKLDVYVCMHVQFNTSAWNMSGGKMYIMADDKVAPPKLKTKVKSFTKIARNVINASN